MVTASGDLVSLSQERDGDSFEGAVVALGGLGVVTSLTLRVIPSFDVRQYVFVDVDLADIFDHFDEVMACACSVSPFTDWRSGKASVWVKERVAPDDEVEPNAGTESRYQLFGMSPSTSPRHPSDDERSASCTEQQGVTGAWHERLPHFRLDHTPSVGAELQSEYFVPRAHAVEALLAVHGLREEIAPLLHISEIRSIAADNLWMSPCYQQDCIAIHFTWKLDWLRVRPLLSRIEAALSPFDPRPHWGKLSTLSPASVQARYSRLAEFRDLLRRYDPDGKFRNSFLDRFVFSDRTAGDRPR
jgi:xylitol oxidase